MESLQKKAVWTEATLACLLFTSLHQTTENWFLVKHFAVVSRCNF